MEYQKVFIFFFAFLLKIAHCQELLNITQNQLDYNITIYEIKYDINKEKIPNILTDLVVKNAYINDLQFQKVLSDLNIESLPAFYLQLWMNPGIEILFQESPTNLAAFIRIVIDKFPKKKETLKSVLELLNIDFNNFISALALDEEDDLYKYLRSVTHDPTILDQASKIANMSMTDLIRLAQVEVIDPITQKSFEECLDIFGKNTVKNFLNQSLFNVKIENIKEDSLVYTILTNLTTLLNEQPIWAVETKNGIISIPKTHHIYDEVDDYMEVNLENILNNTDKKIIRDISKDDERTYSIIQIDNYTLSTDVIITDDYKTISNDCIYLKKSAQELEIVNATISEKKGLFVYVPYSGLGINIGSPLICNEIIYGLLTNQTEGKLQFLLLRNDLDDGIGDIDIDIDYTDGSFLPQLSIICLVLSFVVNLAYIL